MYEAGRDDYDGTVLQLHHNGKNWRGQMNVLSGSLFPDKNFVLEFDKKVTLWDQFKVLITSKDSVLYIFGLGVFFGYLMYRYVYVSKRSRKDLVDVFMENRFKRN